jgi:hypothetical protein
MLDHWLDGSTQSDRLHCNCPHRLDFLVKATLAWLHATPVPRRHCIARDTVCQMAYSEDLV